MKNGLEIERKFLVRLPVQELKDVRRDISILQTYLTDGQNGLQRRVRRITDNGSTTYVYTEKIFYTPMTRKETEYEISESEYTSLIKEAKKEIAPVNKQRICFDYRDQLFELDIYPFSDNFAIMELELSHPEQEIYFPEFINIIKEVTGVDSYSNSALANAGAFPEDAEIFTEAKGVI